jgi:hypothetical protein
MVAQSLVENRKIKLEAYKTIPLFWFFRQCVSPTNMKIVFDEFLPQWNYTAKPELQVQ